MKKYLPFLFAVLIAQPAYADGMPDDDVDVASTDTAFVETTTPVAASSPITLSHLKIPAGYVVSTFAYTNSLTAGSCLHFTVRPVTAGAAKFMPGFIHRAMQRAVTINIPLTDDKNQNYSGIVDSVEYQSANGTYVIEACDAMKKLQSRSGNKLFLNQTRVEPIKDTLDENHIHYVFDLRTDYPTIEFTTRFGETDLNFVNRLMEEIGIFYTLKKIDDEDVFVFTDSLDALAAYSKEVSYKDIRQPDENGKNSPDFSLSYESKTQDKNYELSDYDLFHNKFVSARANDRHGDHIQKEFQLSDYAYDGLKKEAEIKVASYNGASQLLHLTTGNLDVEVGDRTRIDGYSYVVTEQDLNYICDSQDSCRADNSLTLVPADIRYANPMSTSVPMMNSTLIGVISDASKDEYGRLGFRFAWMEDQAYDQMYRAMTSAHAQGLDYAEGDKVIVTFINGFMDRPLIIDKLQQSTGSN